MKKTIRTSRYYNLISACLAFMLWGGWAYYINHSNVTKSGVASGLAQGTASFIITLLMVHAVTYLHHRFRHPIARLLLPALITLSFTSLCLLSIHLFVGTAHIFYTISPALTIAFIFCVFTSYQLNKINRIHNE